MRIEEHTRAGKVIDWLGHSTTKNRSEYALKEIGKVIGALVCISLYFVKALIITYYASPEHFCWRKQTTLCTILGVWVCNYIFRSLSSIYLDITRIHC